ncbi:MAG: class I SAM-dependent methyltransferase [Candidatus Tectomicrobia bacterium]|uniref:Class I SAM-dependent methyltransferase n=1 Tax=Tectimicrobiota bacterium TaxID=2528274 RepID=A0A932M1H9_UNCTE|nr:class I SAM-dependent methyltransferase [Candidatus Tectomicrobia bacterium]
MKNLIRFLPLIFVVGLLSTIQIIPPGWQSEAFQAQSEPPVLAPFEPTPMEVVIPMLILADIRAGDVLYDLGSGDGRIVIAAAKRYGIRGVGVEIDPELVRESREKARKERVEHLVEFRLQDALTVDLSAATIVTLYLYPDANLLLRPILRKQLRAGARVVSHDFDMGDWKPDKSEKLKDNQGENHTIYLWRIKK